MSVHVDSVSLAWPAVHRSQPPPRPFFRRSSGVIDFPYGDLAGVMSLLKEEELLFVMYYVPWCAQCMAAREEFVKAARYMDGEVSQLDVQFMIYSYSISVPPVI